MFLRKKQNRSGSTSIQIISKAHGKYKEVKTIGSGRSEQEVQKLWYLGKQEIERLTAQSKIFISQQDTVVEQAMESLANASIKTVGPELVFGKVYDHIGFGQIKEDLFLNLVVARLAFPLSKLKTTEYLYRYLGIELRVNTIYRFMDKLQDELKEEVEQIAFAHTKKVLKGNLTVVFYDMTTLYFEASDEDDLRKTGFSKDGKHQNPQIYLGLLVGLGGYAIGYDIFEGDIYEGHTLIPFLESISARFDLGKPVVIADAGLLSKDNLKALQAEGYQYILGARIKNESEQIKQRILAESWKNDKIISLPRKDDTRLIIAHSQKRALKDEHNRQRGLRRLEKQIKSGKCCHIVLYSFYSKYFRI